MRHVGRMPPSPPTCSFFAATFQRLGHRGWVCGWGGGGGVGGRKDLGNTLVCLGHVGIHSASAHSAGPDRYVDGLWSVRSFGRPFCPLAQSDTDTRDTDKRDTDKRDTDKRDTNKRDTDKRDKDKREVDAFCF